MVTLNINIEGDGKTSSLPISTKSLAQQDLPTPTSLTSAEGIESVVPTPESFDNSSESGLTLASVPHPEDSGITISTISTQSPAPDMDSADLITVDTGIPEPSDTEKGGTATPAAKRKPRASKTKTSGK